MKNSKIEEEAHGGGARTWNLKWVKVEEEAHGGGKSLELCWKGFGQMYARWKGSLLVDLKGRQQCVALVGEIDVPRAFEARKR